MELESRLWCAGVCCASVLRAGVLSARSRLPNMASTLYDTFLPRVRLPLTTSASPSALGLPICS